MIATTIINSINVKPCWMRFMEIPSIGSEDELCSAESVPSHGKTKVSGFAQWHGLLPVETWPLAVGAAKNCQNSQPLDG
jgi:hypothetical protein